jgi:hypothetical protein
MQCELQSVKFGAQIFYSDYASFLNDALIAHRPMRKKVSQYANDAQWSGTRTFADAVALAQDGWKHGANMVAELVTSITSKVTGHLQDATMYLDTTTNYCWDMASAVAGVPQCGINFSPTEDKKLVRIVVDCNTSAGVDSSVMLRKAAAIAALVAALEQCNFDAEVIVAFHLRGYRDRKESIQCAVMVKTAGRAVDLDILAYALGHPAFYRRIIFNWMEQFYANAEYTELIANGAYGHILPLTGLSGDITIGYSMYGDSRWTNSATAAKWILEELKNQGVQID